MKTPVFLRIYQNGKLEGIRQFTDEQIVIGANDDIQLPLKGDGVYPLHAVIEERDTGYYVVDLGSPLGTFRGGQKVFDEALNSGDELQIGSFKIEFFIGVPKPTQAPRGPQQPVLKDPVPKGTTAANQTPPPPPQTAQPPVAPAASRSPANEPPAKNAQPQVIPPPLPKKEAESTPAANPIKTTETAKSAPRNTSAKESEPPKASAYKVVDEQKSKIQATGPSGATSKSATVEANLVKRLKTSRGPVVEVVVVWRDVVIDTHHFSDATEVTIGPSEKATISVPLLGVNRPQMTLLKIGPTAKVCFTHEMTGDYYHNDERLTLSDLKRKNRIVQAGSEFELELAQGEMIRLGLMGDLLSIYIRYSQETPVPIVGPFFDLTTSEATAVLTSAVVAAIFGLYMFIYNPQALQSDQKIEEPARIAVIKFDRPVKKVEIVKESAEPKQRKIIKVPEHATQTTTRKNAGRAAELMHRQHPKKSVVVSSAVKRGGAIKTSKHVAGGMKSEKPRDLNHLGLLGVFGSHGTQNAISQAAAGAGELVGDANAKTGYTGGNEQRAGDLGGRLKNIGASGRGASTYGVAGGIGTKGKGSGTYGDGLGGLGKRGRVDLNVGDSEAEFTGSIDKDAIRRVIHENQSSLQFCYDQALRRNSDVYGKIVLHWQIIEHGRAINVGVKSNSVGDKEMGRCIARVIGSLTFPEPPPDTAADVIFPFVFSYQ